ncbi:ATP-binding cassette domain-containing protein [Nonomuraea sp. NBC_01738]|uniref:ATP-binding cassette domain-containing protein n=1 Tax=Nonomuraea sp. NBC_01738 TaxID=2976003 RepID=UPI002E101F8D|nr:ATP-binding cassette domain-containing protein [Nonomuraea sp. NBC_01738]
MIEVAGLTRRYGEILALDELSFRVEPGRVTGFLGVNGAGKSTTMRVILGLEAPDSGFALVEGLPYGMLREPMRRVGALLDAGDVHGGRTAAAHLRWLARSNGIGRARVGEVLEQVGLADVGHRRVAGFSLGMRQRLGIAAALLGDPGVLLLDEPINGLDPEGIRWIRVLLRDLAAEGRTVLVSSHLMGEMAMTADHVVAIGRGRLVADMAMSELAGRFRRGVLVRAADPAALEAALRAAGADVLEEDGGLSVNGLDAARIGEVALAHGIALYELTPRAASLEEAFMELVIR